MPGRTDELHLLSHGCGGGLVLHSTSGSKRRLPSFRTAWRQVYMSAEGPLIRVDFFPVGVVVVTFEPLRGRQVNLAFVLRHQLFPSNVPRIRTEARVVDIERRFLARELIVNRKIGTDIIAIFFSVQS